jgi:hypothetical protein
MTYFELDKLNPEQFSKINFERYLPYLKPYMGKIQYDLDVVDDGTIVLTFHKSDFDLSFKFLKNGKTEILSLDWLDKDNSSAYNPKNLKDLTETMCYVLRGNFSSSSLVEKSYKINRVLSMLDYNSVAVRQVDKPTNVETKSIMDSLKVNNGESLTSLNPNEKSKNNFQRYLPYLKSYLDKHTYHLNVNKGIISLHFETDNFSLLLTFLTNGKVGFLSLDRDFSEEEQLCYIYEGALSTSNLVSKSWKINRLLTILD